MHTEWLFCEALRHLRNRWVTRTPSGIGSLYLVYSLYETDRCEKVNRISVLSDHTWPSSGTSKYYKSRTRRWPSSSSVNSRPQPPQLPPTNTIKPLRHTQLHKLTPRHSCNSINRCDQKRNFYSGFSLQAIEANCRSFSLSEVRFFRMKNKVRFFMIFHSTKPPWEMLVLLKYSRFTHGLNGLSSAEFCLSFFT